MQNSDWRYPTFRKYSNCLVLSALWWYGGHHMTHIMRIWWHWHVAMLSWRQDHILTENIWFVWSKTSYSGDERCYRCGTTNDDDYEQWRKGAGWFGSVQPFIRCTYLWQWLDARCIRISSTHPCWSVTNTKCTWPAYLLSFASLFSTCEQQIFKSLCRCKSYFSEPLNASPSYFFPLKTCQRARFPTKCTRGESDQDQIEGNWRVEVSNQMYTGVRRRPKRKEWKGWGGTAAAACPVAVWPSQSPTTSTIARSPGCIAPIVWQSSCCTAATVWLSSCNCMATVTLYNRAVRCGEWVEGEGGWPGLRPGSSPTP